MWVYHICTGATSSHMVIICGSTTYVQVLLPHTGSLDVGLPHMYRCYFLTQGHYMWVYHICTGATSSHRFIRCGSTTYVQVLLPHTWSLYVGLPHMYRCYFLTQGH